MIPSVILFPACQMSRVYSQITNQMLVVSVQFLRPEEHVLPPLDFLRKQFRSRSVNRLAYGLTTDPSEVCSGFGDSRHTRV